MRLDDKKPSLKVEEAAALQDGRANAALIEIGAEKSGCSLWLRCWCKTFLRRRSFRNDRYACYDMYTKCDNKIWHTNLESWLFVFFISNGADTRGKLSSNRWSVTTWWAPSPNTPHSCVFKPQAIRCRFEIKILAAIKICKCSTSVFFEGNKMPVLKVHVNWSFYDQNGEMCQ